MQCHHMNAIGGEQKSESKAQRLLCELDILENSKLFRMIDSF